MKISTYYYGEEDIKKKYRLKKIIIIKIYVSFFNISSINCLFLNDLRYVFKKRFSYNLFTTSKKSKTNNLSSQRKGRHFPKRENKFRIKSM